MELVRALLERCWFPAAGTPVTCAVSGGSDSLALLVLACRSGCEVTAVHVDHGLRPGSGDEAALVRAVAERFGAACRSEQVVVAPGPNLEERARLARHGVLPPDALLGHTADDQAETVLLHLLRGAGLDGLAGMRPERRPMLALRRADTVALCHAMQLRPFSDPSNDDPRFRRNRVRHELLPLLNDIAARDVVPLLVRQAGHARQAAEVLEAAAADLDPTDARALADAPPALAGVAIRSWLRAGDDQCRPPDSATVQRVLDVAHGRARAAEVGGGRRVERHRQRLSITN